ERRLHILPNPVEIEIEMRSDESKLVLQAGYQNGETFTLIQKRIEVVASNPTWLLMDDRLAQIGNTQALPMLSSLPIEIPIQQADVFRERYFAQMVQLLPMRSVIIHWHDIAVEPIPRLYLHDDKDNILRADLRFGYGDQELSATKSGEAITVETVPDSWDLMRVHRQ